MNKSTIKECDRCYGTGVIPYDEPDLEGCFDWDGSKCWECEGNGKIDCLKCNLKDSPEDCKVCPYNPRDDGSMP